MHGGKKRGLTPETIRHRRGLFVLVLLKVCVDTGSLWVIASNCLTILFRGNFTQSRFFLSCSVLFLNETPKFIKCVCHNIEIETLNSLWRLFHSVYGLKGGNSIRGKINSEAY